MGPGYYGQRITSFTTHNSEALHYSYSDWIQTHTGHNQPPSGALPSRIVERPHSPDAASLDIVLSFINHRSSDDLAHGDVALFWRCCTTVPLNISPSLVSTFLSRLVLATYFRTAMRGDR